MQENKSMKRLFQVHHNVTIMRIERTIIVSKKVLQTSRPFKGFPAVFRSLYYTVFAKYSLTK